MVSVFILIWLLQRGLAVALAPSRRTLSLDAGAAALLASGKLPSLRTLFSPLFWRESGQRSYTVAGSFLQYLLNTLGPDTVRSLYKGADWVEATGRSMDELQIAWRAYLRSFEDDERLGLLTNALYNEPGTLTALCPHSKVDLKRARSAGLYARLRQPIGWQPDRDYLRWLDALENSSQRAIDAQHPLQNAQPFSRHQFISGLSAAAKKPHQNDKRLREDLKLLAKRNRQPVTSLNDVTLRILESDLRAAIAVTNTAVRGRQAEIATPFQSTLLQSTPFQSTPRLQKLLQLSHRVFLGHNLTRQLHARLAILAAYQSGALSSPTLLAWRRYLAGWSSLPKPWVRLNDDKTPWILRYLTLRKFILKDTDSYNLNTTMQWDDATRRQLLNARVPQSLPETFAEEWWRLLGQVFMEQGAYNAATIAYGKAAVLPNSFNQQIFEEHKRRAQFYRRNEL